MAKDLKKMKKAELLKFARSINLNLPSRMLKADIIEIIERNAPRRKSTTTAAKAATSKKPKKAKTGKRAAARGGKTGIKRKPAKAKTKAKAARVKGKAKKIAAGAKQAPKRAVPHEPAAREKRIAAETIRQKAVASKYYLGTEDRAMPPVEAIDVPASYGIDRIGAMVRDPHWIFSYWEVTPDKFAELEQKFGKRWPKCRMILRVYDLTNRKKSHFDIEPGGDTRNWYISVRPERRYQVAIGMLSPGGKFIQIAISNTVETPRGTISDVIDDRWMVPDEIFRQIFAASGGHDMLAGSEELRKLLEERLLEQVSSGAVSSMGSAAMPRKGRERGFRLWINTELILYGGTEPDASVTVQGKEVKLRGDGTFSLRFALPDGKIDLPVTAVSADKVEERTIDTSVRKKSECKEPVLR